MESRIEGNNVRAAEYNKNNKPKTWNVVCGEKLLILARKKYLTFSTFTAGLQKRFEYSHHGMFKRLKATKN